MLSEDGDLFLNAREIVIRGMPKATVGQPGEATTEENEQQKPHGQEAPKAN